MMDYGQYIIQNHHHIYGPSKASVSCCASQHNFHIQHVCNNNDYQGSGHIEGLAILWKDGTETKTAGNCLNDIYRMKNARYQMQNCISTIFLSTKFSRGHFQVTLFP